MNAAPRRVRKRDGREAPFDVRKIADAIDKAIRATGREDRGLADELASVVALSLARREGAATDVPTIEQIQDLVERVLIETGHAAVAKAYILYRDKRARVREALAVHHSRGDQRSRGDRGGAAPPRAASSHRSEAWSKGKIVAALMMEAELARELAEEIAARVEQRVFESGFTRVSTGLLRELVDNELFARGLESKLRQQTIVGLPKYDLREGLRSGFFVDQGELVAPSGPPETTIARALLAKYAVEDVLPPRLADRHLAGDLHFDGLEAPHRDVAGALSLRGLRERAFPALAALPPARDLEETLDLVRHLVARARRAVSGALVLHSLDALVAAPAKGARRPKLEDAAARCVRALALGRADGELTLALETTSPLAAPIVAEVSAFAERGLAPTVVLLPRGEGVASSGGAHPTRLAFASAEERALAPGVRLHRADADAAFVTTGAMAVLNLPRLAYAAESYREGRLLESLLPLVDDAVEGLAALRESLAQTAVSRGVDLPSPRRSFGLAFVGLRECVRAMCGGAVDTALARSIVQAIVERSRASAASRGLRVFVEPWLPSRARGRFERLDAELCPAARAFHDGDRVRYGEGATLSPAPGLAAGAAEGEATAGIAAGVLPSARDADEAAAFASAFAHARSGLRSAAPRDAASRRVAIRRHRSHGTERP